MMRLAWILQCESCTNIVELIKDLIFSDDFCSRYKKSPEFFTRERVLTFPTLIFFMINFRNGSNQNELDNYFKALNNLECAERIVSKSAFTKARAKLDYHAFIELNHQMTDFFYREFPAKTWNGFNLMAIDGSTSALPMTKEISEHFGEWNSGKDTACPVARVSQMYDVMNKVTVDAIIKPKKEGERELAAWHFLRLLPADLILLDRGYPAYWLFNLILSLNSNFCARISCTQWVQVRDFFESGENERIIYLKPSHASLEKCREFELDETPLCLRLIRVELKNGETEILITSLIDSEEFPHNIFGNLYIKRWPVEEDYKLMKCRIEIERFSGESVESVYQDFHAKVFSKNLTLILVQSVKDHVQESCVNRKYEYQINITQAFSKMKNTIVLLFNRTEGAINGLINKIMKIITITLESIRPGRTFPRKHKIRKKRYNPVYKPIC